MNGTSLRAPAIAFSAQIIVMGVSGKLLFDSTIYDYVVRAVITAIIFV